MGRIDPWLGRIGRDMPDIGTIEVLEVHFHLTGVCIMSEDTLNQLHWYAVIK